MIFVVAIEGEVYFQVKHDNRKYFDLDGIEYAHPELRNHIYENRYNLNRELMQKRELLEM